MKKGFVGFLVIIVLLYISIFSANDYQVGIVTNRFTKKVTLYTSGLHFLIPYFETVEYVNNGMRSNILTTQLKLEESGNLTIYKANFAINWHITFPLNYYKYLDSNSIDGVIKQIKDVVQEKINNKVQAELGLNYFNKNKNFIEEPFLINRLGVMVNDVRLVQIVPYHDGQASTANNDKKLIVQFESLNAQQIESAYFVAQNIIVQTEIEKATLYDDLDRSDNRFYEYYRKLNVYKDSTKSKIEFPPLNKLY
ncbi:MAG: SPFH domain-containing protein [Neisseriaceae bacterium]